jgi:REP element-mobilizing transposase RayT
MRRVHKLQRHAPSCYGLGNMADDAIAYPPYKMSIYRRHRVPGGTYFFTVNLLERHACARLLVEHIQVLREAVRVAKNKAPFLIDTWVVLHEYMHYLAYEAVSALACRYLLRGSQRSVICGYAIAREIWSTVIAPAFWQCRPGFVHPLSIFRSPGAPLH